MSTDTRAAEWALNLPVSGLVLPAPVDRSLLQTVLAAGRPWPSSCRNGTCRACIGHLAEGAVRYSVEWPGLLPEEKAQGAVLPCVAYPVSDVTLLPPPD